MPEPTPEAWAQIRHEYEHTDKPLAHICDDHEITIPMLRYRMKRWEWTRRKPLIPRQGPPPVAVVAPPERAPFSPLPLPSPGGGGSANAEGMSRGGVSFLRETFTPPRSQDARDPPPPGEGKDKIIPRLQSAAARILPAIEATIARLSSGTLNAADLEKAGRTLATLMRTLRELNALLIQHDAPLEPEDDPVPKDMDEFRYELARRIRGFLAARQHEQAAQPDQGAGPEPQKCALPAVAMDGPARA